MTVLAKRIATALIFCVGASGALGCQLVATVDGRKIDGGTGSGGHGSDGASTTSTSAASSSTSTSSPTSSAASSATSTSGSGGPWGTGGAPACGDGIVNHGEECDDGNVVELDGCSSTCTIDSFAESESNDAVATANGPFTPSPELIVRGTIQPGFDVDVFAIVLPATADLHLETFDEAGPSTCKNIDTVLTLIGPDGSTGIAVDDDGGVGGCSKIDSNSSPGAAHLSAGTYFVKVAAYDGFKPIPGYTLVVTFDARCGDGKKQGHEQCDGGAGCTATCDRVPACGDGFVDGAEQCDDANPASGDGCSATCQYELLSETEPNDTAPTASGPFKPSALLGGAITPGTDVDFFKITVPATADLKIQTFDASGPSSCAAIDTVITLIGVDGATTLIQRDQGGVNDCGTIDSNKPADSAARHLTAGTYFIKVEDYQNNTVIPAYTLLATFNSLCGDGVVSGVEQCDGDPGCTATCDRMSVCGDGLVDAPESCDDGNTTAGDGCGATCALESIAEVEPNDDLAAADAGPVTITASTVISAAISPALDRDFFAMTLAQAAVIRLETFDAGGTDCSMASSIQTTLRVWNSVGAELYADDNSGIFTCSALVVSLAAGSYHVSVEERTGALPIAGYQLQASFEGSAGLELEPDGTRTTATPLPGSDVVIGGDHALGTDADYFAITVPAGKSLRAEIVEGDAETCESGDVDSFLTLFDANGLALGEDDDSGRGFCSRIDGTGAEPADAYAHDVAAGTYYLLVEAAPTAQAPGDTTGQFTYKLAITLR